MLGLRLREKLPTKKKRVDVLQGQRKTWLAAERESKKRMRVEELPEYIRGITSCISATFDAVKN